MFSYTRCQASVVMETTDIRSCYSSNKFLTYGLKQKMQKKIETLRYRDLMAALISSALLSVKITGI